MKRGVPVQRLDIAEADRSSRWKGTDSMEADATALAIAGSDPSGGAGLQADLKTFQQLGVYGMSVVTLLTVQNTRAVSRVEVLPSELVLAQLDAVISDIAPRAIKTGALGTAEVVRALGERLVNDPAMLVVDPVLVSKHGNSLADEDVAEAYRTHLLTRADLITPNRFEAERLSGVTLGDEDSLERATKALLQLGARRVLIKAGTFNDKSLHVYADADGVRTIESERLDASNTHGTGCILAATITAQLATGATDFFAVAERAVAQTHQSIACNTRLGRGIHPAETRAISPG
jgi:hydroxymethylpyrimidine/phosphomethylpyrimidine kinase